MRNVPTPVLITVSRGTENRVSGHSPADRDFHRPPREWPAPSPAEELRIHAPPPRPKPPTGGWIQALFPVIGSFTMVGFAFVYKNRLFMYIAVGLVCVSIAFAV